MQNKLPLKIAWLHEHLLLWNGGVKCILEASRKMNQLCETDVWVAKASPGNKKLFQDAGVPFKEFSKVTSNNLLYWFLYPYFIWRNSRRLKPLLSNYDVIISSSPTTCFIAANMGKPTIFIIFEPNGWLYSPDYISGLSPVKRLLLTIGRNIAVYFDHRIMRSANALIAPDKFTAMRSEKIYRKKVDVLYLGADHELFTQKHDWSIESQYSGNIIIHSATYLNPIKGTRYLIEALPHIVKHIPECKLLILNPEKEEQEREKFTKLARNLGVDSNIEFLPAINECDLPYYFSMSKVIVQPSLNESIRMSLIEAASCGTPGVAFSGGTAGEDIIDQETGLIAPIYNTKALAEKIVNILESPTLRESLGAKAKILSNNRFSWDLFSEGLIQKAKEITHKY